MNSADSRTRNNSAYNFVTSFSYSTQRPYHKIFNLSAFTTPSALRWVLSQFQSEFFHTVRSSASSFNFQYRRLSLSPYGSCVLLLHRLHITCMPPTVFPSISCFRRHFPRNLWRIQLTFLRLIFCRMLFSSWTLCNTSFLT